MTPTQHAELLGRLVTNFHSLETALRMALLTHAKPQDPNGRLDFESIPVGTAMSVNQLTDYDTLGQLIARFNERMKLLGNPEIDGSLVEVRDAIAHGRVLCDEDEFPLRLIKFDRPDKATGLVRLAVNQIMSEMWFQKRIARTHVAIQIAIGEAKA